VVVPTNDWLDEAQRCPYCGMKRPTHPTVRFGQICSFCLSKAGYDPADLKPSTQFPDEMEVGNKAW